MKLLKLPLFLLMLTFLAACGEKDEENQTPSNALAGTWKLTTLEYEGKSTTSVYTTSYDMNFTGEGYDMDFIVKFNDDNSYTSAGDYSIKLTSELAGQSFEYDWTNQNFFGEGNYKKENDKLYTTANGSEVQESQIIMLNETTLTIANGFTRTEVQGESTIISKVNAEMTFERQ